MRWFSAFLLILGTSIPYPWFISLSKTSYYDINIPKIWNMVKWFLKVYLAQYFEILLLFLHRFAKVWYVHWKTAIILTQVHIKRLHNPTTSLHISCAFSMKSNSCLAHIFLCKNIFQSSHFHSAVDLMCFYSKKEGTSPNLT